MIFIKAETRVDSILFWHFGLAGLVCFFNLTHLNRSYHLLISENTYPEELAPE